MGPKVCNDPCHVSICSYLFFSLSLLVTLCLNVWRFYVSNTHCCNESETVCVSRWVGCLINFQFTVTSAHKNSCFYFSPPFSFFHPLVQWSQQLVAAARIPVRLYSSESAPPDGGALSDEYNQSKNFGIRQLVRSPRVVATRGYACEPGTVRIFFVVFMTILSFCIAYFNLFWCSTLSANSQSCQLTVLTYSQHAASVKGATVEHLRLFAGSHAGVPEPGAHA
jgi:hypothetical protein